MAYTLLDGVNKVLIHNKEVDTHGALTSLVDSPRQVEIDRAVQKWTQLIAQLFSYTAKPLPNQGVESHITLVADKRTYPIPTGFIKMYWPLRNDSRGYRIWPYDQTQDDWGYQDLLAADLTPAQSLGLPERAAFTATRRELYMDRTPTAAEAGLVFKFQYTRHFALSNEDDTFPFPDAVVDELVPAVGEMMRDIDRDNPTLAVFLANAARLMSPNPMREYW